MKYLQINRVVTLLFLLHLIGCATPTEPINVREYKLDAPSNIVLPIDGSLDVYLPPEIGSRIINHNGINANEGALLKRTAKKTFPKVFREVNLVESPSAEFLATVTNVSSSVSSFSGTHKVTISVDVKQLSGKDFGVFIGNGSATSGVVFSNAALESAFIEAFMDALQQFIETEEFINVAL